MEHDTSNKERRVTLKRMSVTTKYLEMYNEQGAQFNSYVRIKANPPHATVYTACTASVAYSTTHPIGKYGPLMGRSGVKAAQHVYQYINVTTRQLHLQTYKRACYHGRGHSMVGWVGTHASSIGVFALHDFGKAWAASTHIDHLAPPEAGICACACCFCLPATMVA